MTIGWIKLHRLLLEKEIFQDAYVLKTFIYLLLKAAYKETSIRVGNRSIELAPGQLLYGRQRVSQRLNIGEGKLRGIMNYLVQKGSIEIEAHSKYSIVTIANWEQYQKGDGEPDFPFDVDFLDDDEEGDDEEPAENQMPMQSEIDFQDLDDDFSANREPQYNNINKYKNNNIIKNKTRENNKKENNNKTKEEHQAFKNITNIQNTENIRNMKNLSSRQSCSVDDEPARISALDIAERVAGQDTSQEMLLSGGVVSKGKVGCVDSANIFDAEDSSGALEALSAMDDAASLYESDFTPDPCETEYLAARKLFHELWNRYPIQLGKEKVSDAQIMRLYEVGEHQMKRAIFNYKNSKHRVPKKYWMHGSTFFNGGYENYL